ncbi:MAG: S-layer homology domain-containing protein [Microcystaceae cyanobacterium]
MNKLSTTLLVSGLSSLIFVPQLLAQNANFGDLQGYWASRYVTALVDRSIISGFPDGSFQPNADITRAQFAAIAVKALDLPSGDSTNDFADIPPNYWASPAIRAISKSGLVAGFPDGTFRPEERITRAQVLVILANALGNQTTSNPNQFNRYSDYQTVPNWATTSVSKAANAGILVNYPDSSRINPNQLATRGEVAALMYQTLVKLGNPNFSPMTVGMLEVGTNYAPIISNKLVIENVETNVTDRRSLRLGDELFVTAYGTPNSRASFKLTGLNNNRAIAMTEVGSGIYEGRYVIRRNDRQRNSKLTVNLAQQNLKPITRNFNQAIAINSARNSNNSPVVANISNLEINRIEINTTAIQSLNQGDELLVTAYGTPRSQASFKLLGLNKNRAVAMTEIKNGVYQGRYTLGKNDGQTPSKFTVNFSKPGISSITKEFNQAIAIKEDN